MEKPRLTAGEVESLAESYFARCDEEGCLYGEAGLALALGVTLETLRSWYDGGCRRALQSAVRGAYLRIQAQLESKSGEKGGSTRALFFLKQPRLGGYSDKGESGPKEMTVHIRIGKNMDRSDFL